MTITNKKQMLEKIGSMETSQINCLSYENGSNKLVISYKGETIKYIDDNVLNVCWFAVNCNGASNKDYSILFNKTV